MPMNHEPVKLKRDVTAVVIPSGEKMLVKTGVEVMITQALGGSYTVTTEDGHMVRIEAGDADALGFEVKKSESAEETRSVEEKIWDELKTCYDPEIPVNIVDLGLIYKCDIQKHDHDYDVRIDMTLTAPGCGMGDILKGDVETKILKIPHVRLCDVQMVFDPPWDQTRMSEAAKVKLGLI